MDVDSLLAVRRLASPRERRDTAPLRTVLLIGHTQRQPKRSTAQVVLPRARTERQDSRAAKGSATVALSPGRLVVLHSRTGGSRGRRPERRNAPGPRRRNQRHRRHPTSRPQPTPAATRIPESTATVNETHAPAVLIHQPDPRHPACIPLPPPRHPRRHPQRPGAPARRGRERPSSDEFGGCEPPLQPGKRRAFTGSRRLEDSRLRPCEVSSTGREFRFAAG